MIPSAMPVEIDVLHPPVAIPADRRDLPIQLLDRAAIGILQAKIMVDETPLNAMALDVPLFFSSGLNESFPAL